MFRTLRGLLSGAALVFLACTSFAQELPKNSVAFYIEPQLLPDALNAWAQQAGVQLVWRASATGTQQMAPRVFGHFTPRNALQSLLRGSGFTYSLVDGNTVAIRPESDVTTQRIALLERSVGFPDAAAARTADAQGIPSSGDRREEARLQVKEELEEVVVTGTHIRGTRDLPTPSLAVTAQDIQRAGFVTVQELLRTIPQNFAGVGADGGFSQGGSLLARSNTVAAAGIDLRGLGSQSTLVLVNGQRRAGVLSGRVVDISTIPLAAIERVEIVTGGRSAVYGSDAVAGVVNFVLRRRFDGAETQASYGFREDSGAEHVQVGQTFGQEYARGGFVAAYQYSRDGALDLQDTDSIVSPSAIGFIPREVDLSPNNRQHSGLLSGEFALTEGIQLYADGLYTSKKNDAVQDFSFPGVGDFDTDIDNSGSQYSASAGVRVELANDWRLDLSGGVSESENRQTYTSLFDGAGTPSVFSSRSNLSTAGIVADGTLLSVGGVDVRAALGAQWRDERLKDKDLLTGLPTSDAGRTVRSAFAEFQVPLVSDGDRPGLRRLELSLAGRLDRYQDFGSTFNPQFGVIWGPTQQLAIRSSYSKAFRAPDLFDLATNSGVYLYSRSDPMSPSGSSVVLQRAGGNNQLDAEHARTWSIGFDYDLPVASLARISASYFDIDYTNRLDYPAVGSDESLVLEREASFAALIDRNPDAAALAAILGGAAFFVNNSGVAFDPSTEDLLTAFPSLVVFDNRLNNVATERVQGFDLGIETGFDSGFGDLTFGLNGTYTRRHDRRLTTEGSLLELVNEVGKPVDFRFRANAGWQRGLYGVFAYANYVDHYRNPFTTPVSAMGSWATFDLSFRLDGTGVVKGGALDGFAATISVRNIFDKRAPEFPNNDFGVGYDTANASAEGRYVSVHLLKKW